MFNYAEKDLEYAHKLDAVPAAGPDYEEHYHDFYELFFFVSGSAVYTVETEHHALAPGDALLIQPGKHHYVTFNDASPYERYVLKFPEYLLPDYLKEKFDKRSAFFLNAQKVEPLFRKLDDLYATYESNDLYVLCSHVAVEIVIDLNRLFPDTKPLVADNKITPILQYINDNLNRQLTIGHLCEKFYFSQSYICKEFRAYMKIPIMKYIRTKKIVAAHKLIMQGTPPLRAAEKYGYNDYSTFYRAYISVMGYPPAAHREKPTGKL